MIDEQFWPASAAFLNLDSKRAETDSRARCTAVAICDEQGQPARTFYQGQVVHFFYEFEVTGRIGVPVGGLEFHDASGRVIHGKNSLQFNAPLPQAVPPGAKLRYHHAIKLDVAPDHYLFTVGLASVSPAIYKQFSADTLSHEQLHSAMVEHCRATDFGEFSVSLQPVGKLQHYGAADLPSTSSVQLIESTSKPVAPSALARDESTQPTIFHITHWKAGSQWIFRILRTAVPKLIVPAQNNNEQLLEQPIEAGKVYPTVYVTRQQFESVQLPANWRCFVMIRDLRDTLISGYFSIKVSHPIETSHMATLREILRSRSQEDGLRFLMRQWLVGNAQIQQSWLDSGEPLIRYEDVLENDVEILEQVLIDQCKLPVDRTAFRKIVVNNRFERLTRGRQRGQEEVTSHARKGVAGDWQNYFTETMKSEFKKLYGDLLIAAGYEQDNNW
jgi:lipopolysaccharide transport system ATP-binding protein